MMKIPNKMIYVLAGIVAGATITLVTTTNAAQIAKRNAAESSETISSEISTVNSSEVSEILSSAEPSSAVSSEVSTPESKPAESKTPIESATDAGVSKIQKATDDGVSQIHEETQRAVQEVQKAVSEVTSSESGPKVAYERKKITGDGGDWNVSLAGGMQEIDEADKCLVIHYGGTYPGLKDAQVLIDAGFALKNAQGNAVEYQPNGFCSFKVPYENLSDVSELYFTYQDQSIRITVTE